MGLFNIFKKTKTINFCNQKTINFCNQVTTPLDEIILVETIDKDNHIALHLKSGDVLMCSLGNPADSKKLLQAIEDFRSNNTARLEINC